MEGAQMEAPIRWRNMGFTLRPGYSTLPADLTVEALFGALHEPLTVRTKNNLTSTAQATLTLRLTQVGLVPTLDSDQLREPLWVGIPGKDVVDGLQIRGHVIGYADGIVDEPQAIPPLEIVGYAAFEEGRCTDLTFQRTDDSDTKSDPARGLYTWIRDLVPRS